MKQTHLREGDLALPEELPSTRNTGGVLTAEVPVAANGNGNGQHGGLAYTVKYLPCGEVILKSEAMKPDGAPVWVKVIKLGPAVAEHGRDRDDGGWVMSEHDRSTSPLAVPIALFRWTPRGPKQTFLAEVRLLEAKLENLKARHAKDTSFMGDGYLEACEAVQREIAALERREEERRSRAKRLSARKRPPKSERLKIKKPSSSPKNEGKKDGKKSKKGKKGKQSAEEGSSRGGKKNKNRSRK